MRDIKVLVIDDSAFIRTMLKDLLETDNSIKVVSSAKNGKEAIEYIKLYDVDVITLDVQMPIMDGIETLKEIMKVKPTPVVMLSSVTKEGAEMTFKALDLGAVNFIAKPDNVFNISSSEQIQEEIIDKVKEASKIRVSKFINLNTISDKNTDIDKQTKIEEQLIPISKPIKKTEMEIKRELNINHELYINHEFNINNDSNNSQEINKIVGIGTSTGGPRALQEVISNLSENFPAPVLIVQHMPKGFTKSLAERLNTISLIKVKEAEDNEILCNSTAYIAPGDKHLKIESIGKKIYRIKLDDGPNVSGHKPSVDALFYSMSDAPTKDIVAVIMTGMGSDGSKAMAHLKKEKKSINIVEDESTCIVFGMPKSAIATGQVDKVVPLNRIASELNKILGV